MTSSTIVLRTIVALLGAALLILAAYLHVKHADPGAVTIIVLDGALITGGILFERRRYRPNISDASGNWQATGETFKDPSTGKVMTVVYDPKTGERNYVEV